MSLTYISISSDSNTESVRSSASHVILSYTDTTIVEVPAIVPKGDSETEPSEAPPSPDYDDSSSNDVPETAGLEVQAAPTPPAPLQIVPALPVLPRKPAIFV
ncbi:hypothetical protein Tco_1249826 [Tanacetum coccineum]